jgi:hypothetical protein
MNPALAALIILGAGACWTVSLYAWPYRPCWKCSGRGRNKGSNKRRFGTCTRCGGTGRRRRIGTRLVHRSVLSVLAERRRNKIARGREKGGEP